MQCFSPCSCSPQFSPAHAVQKKKRSAPPSAEIPCGYVIPFPFHLFRAAFGGLHFLISRPNTLSFVASDSRGVSRMPLTIRCKFTKLGSLFAIAPSSNGKTADSGSAYRGSNPCGAAHQPVNRWFLRPYRLTVRTEPSQGSNTGSIPVKATRCRISGNNRLTSRFLPAGFFRSTSSALHAPVAQLDRASDYGSEGWGFKSLRVHS